MIPFLHRFIGWRKAPSLAFAGTVMLACLGSLWEGAIDPRNSRGAGCLIMGFCYALLGMIDFTFLCRQAGGWVRALYLCTQTGLLFGIFWTGRLSGETSLCVYPLVAAMVSMLAPSAATLGVAGLYAMTLGIEGHFYGTGPLLRWSISLLSGFGFIVIFTRIALKERAARTRAEALAAEVEKLAVIQERNRLAREIHDSLGHFLTTIHVQLEAARTIHATDPDGALTAVAKAQGLAREALVEVRRSVGALQADRAPAPLAARLRDLAVATDGWGAAVSLQILGPVQILAPATEHALFRAAQEGLTNVRKHARAQTALVLLDHREPRRVCLQVTDDGRGAGADPGADGCGIAGLRERCAALGGRVFTEQPAGGGFRLRVEIPA